MRSIDRRLSELESKVNTEPAEIVVVWDDSERDPDAITVEWDDDEKGSSEFEWRLEKVYGGDDND